MGRPEHFVTEKISIRGLFLLSYSVPVVPPLFFAVFFACGEITVDNTGWARIRQTLHMGVHKARSGRWQKVPVDAGISFRKPKCICLRKESIHYLLAAERSDSVINGDNSYYVTFTKRKQVWECNTLAANEPPAIGECRCDRKNSVSAERATLSI
jgi:hypothetical protein